MPEPVPNLTVRTLANGATAQLRSLVEFADREEARRLHAELLRLAKQLAAKHDFGKTEVRKVVNVG